MKLNFRKIGESGQPIIILHGLFGMSDNWLTIGKVFAENHIVYLLDLRNHGQSPRSEAFSYDIMAADLTEFIQDHSIDKPILIGHSMGGKVIMQFAIEQPQMFDKMIVVDIAPRFYPVHHHPILQGLQAVNLKSLQSRTEANEVLKTFEESEGVRQFLLKNLFRNPELGHFDWRINIPVITKNIENVGEEITSNKQISNESMFISGSESSYITQEDRNQILQIFPNAVFEVVKGAGHWVQADKPKEFEEIVNMFIDT
jgi:esterase